MGGALPCIACECMSRNQLLHRQSVSDNKSHHIWCVQAHQRAERAAAASAHATQGGHGAEAHTTAADPAVSQGGEHQHHARASSGCREAPSTVQAGEQAANEAASGDDDDAASFQAGSDVDDDDNDDDDDAASAGCTADTMSGTGDDGSGCEGSDAQDALEGPDSATTFESNVALVTADFAMQVCTRIKASLFPPLADAICGTVATHTNATAKMVHSP